MSKIFLAIACLAHVRVTMGRLGVAEPQLVDQAMIGRLLEEQDDAVSVSGWQCLPERKIEYTLGNTSAAFSVGDCILISDADDFERLQGGDRSISLEAYGFEKGTMGMFEPDTKACRGNGLVLTSTFVKDEKAKQVDTGAPIKCPAGQKAVVVGSVDTSALAPTESIDHLDMCGKKFGNNWEKDHSGLLCYPKCKKGFFGVGPVCWAQCPSGFHDGGVFCTKPRVLQPHARAILVGKCRKDEFRYGFQCLRKCSLYGHDMQKYFGLTSYFCGTKCPSGFSDAGRTCTKHSYGRGAGKATPAIGGEIAILTVASIAGAIIAAASVVAVLGTAGAAAPYVALADEALLDTSFIIFSEISWEGSLDLAAPLLDEEYFSGSEVVSLSLSD